MVPSMCATASLAFFGNCYIVACIPWIRRRSMNANLRWSLSLAAADAYAALLILFGLVFNTYLPQVYNYNRLTSACFRTCLEAFRIGGMLTSVLHLLALSLNHYASIADPLKHKLMMTSLRTKLITVVMWISPTATLLICFGSVPGQLFQSEYCRVNRFYFESIFRATIFIFFYAPMLTMLVVYGKILTILYQSRKNIANLSPQCNSEEMSNNRKLSHSNGRMNSIRIRMKAVTTTLLIVGTFGLGWLPSVIFFVTVCTNCLVTNVGAKKMFYINVVFNSLIILKLLINPLIYGFRILEIRYALWLMYAGRCRRIPQGSRPLPKQFQAISCAYSVSA